MSSVEGVNAIEDVGTDGGSVVGGDACKGV